MLKIFAFLCAFIASINAQEIDLSRYEKSIYSQNGEDGVLAEIFKLIGSSSKFCVEFGAYDGINNSNTFLLRMQKWEGLLLDRAFDIPAFNLHKEFITAKNINQLFEKYHVPEQFDLLSIDIDFNDFYIWQALDSKYKPSVVIIEYNATHLPHEDKVVKYQPFFCGDGSNYYGASILAMYRLGRSKGYSLVYAESNGVNLFFIRDDLLEGKEWHFKNVNNVEQLYRSPTYGEGPNRGHPLDSLMRPFLSSQDVIK